MKKLLVWVVVLLISSSLSIVHFSCGKGGADDDTNDDINDDVTDDDVDDDTNDDIDDDVDDDTDDDIDDDTTDDDTDDDSEPPSPQGNIVLLDDPATEAGLRMYYELGNQTTPFEMEWDWRWITGDGMSVQLYKQGGTPDWAAAVDFYSAGGPHIEAFDKNSGWVVCVGSASYNQWYHFKVTVDPSSKKYSVFVNGNPTSCTNLNLNLGLLGKIIGVRVLAYGDVYGGQTTLDNLILTRNGTPFFADDFEDDVVGSPPGAPWTIETSGGASATVISSEE